MIRLVEKDLTELSETALIQMHRLLSSNYRQLVKAGQQVQDELERRANERR